MSKFRSLIAALLGAVVVASLVAPSASAADLSEVGSNSLASAAACAAQSDNYLAVIVVDESGSLEKTDPDDLRVGAIETALDSLVSLAKQSGDGLNVEASLATFGEIYDPLVGWGSVEGSHGEELRSAVRNKLPTRNKALYTDYRAALAGAKSSLESQAANLDGESCKVMLWFSDGKLDVENNSDGSTGAPTQAVADSICTPHGIADDMRASNVHVVALALFLEGVEGAPTAADRALLQRIAEGTADGVACGTDPVPPSWSGGAYLRADDASALRSVFAQAGALIEGGVADASVACPGDRCDNGLLEVPADRGVSRFRVVTDAGLEQRPLVLDAPNGESVTVTAGEQSVGGALVRVTSADGLATVDVTVKEDPALWDSWFVSLGSAEAQASLYYFWDAQVSIDAPEGGLVIGETTDMPLSFSYADGSPIDSSVYGDVQASATASGVDAAVVEDANGSYVVRVSVPADGVPPEVAINVEAYAVTDPNGIRLGPTYAAAKIPTTLPPSYPTVSTTSLTFSDLVGTEPSTATLSVVGAERGDAEVCLGDPDLQFPEDARDVVLTPTARCRIVAAGEEVSFDVSLATVEAADGRVSGTLPVILNGVDGEAPLTVAVPLDASMKRPVDAAAFSLWAVGLVLLAIAFAVATAAIGRHLADRYTFGPAAQYSAVDVEITPAGVVRTGRNGLELDAVDDFHRVASSLESKARVSRKEIDGIRFGRKLPLNPWQQARAVVSHPNRIVTWGRISAATTKGGDAALTEFPGTTGFLLSAEPGDVEPTRARARLVMVVDAPNGVNAALPERLGDVRTASPSDMLAALNAAREARAAGADSATAGKSRKSGTSAVSTLGGTNSAGGDDWISGEAGDNADAVSGTGTGASSGFGGGTASADFLGGSSAVQPVPATTDSASGKQARRERAKRASKAQFDPQAKKPARDDDGQPPIDFLS